MLNFKLVVYFCGSRMFKPLKFYCRKILLSAFVQFGKMSLIFRSGYLQLTVKSQKSLKWLFTVRVLKILTPMHIRRY